METHSTIVEELMPEFNPARIFFAEERERESVLSGEAARVINDEGRR